MTNESFRILTKIGNSHRESELFINWEGVSIEDLKFLAGQAIRANIQASLKKQWNPGNEKIFVKACEVVNHAKASEFGNLEFLGKLDRTPEDRPIKKTKVDVDPISALLDAMTPEQKKEILAMLF